jgi:hypothetical protein
LAAGKASPFENLMDNKTIAIEPKDSVVTNTTNEIAPISQTLKWSYSIFMAVLIPFYWLTYGPSNFLYFCDVAILMVLAGIWLQNRLLVSMAGVGILLPQIAWVADFFATLFGFPLIGMTEYMFRDSIPLFARGLSSFHGWIPFVILYLLSRWGYDKRALLYWSICAWGLMIVCYLWMPAPGTDGLSPNTPVNINYVYGLQETKAQTFMPQTAYFWLLMVVMPLCIYWPTHRLLVWFSRTRS